MQHKPAWASRHCNVIAVLRSTLNKQYKGCVRAANFTESARSDISSKASALVSYMTHRIVTGIPYTSDCLPDTNGICVVASFQDVLEVYLYRLLPAIALGHKGVLHVAFPCMPLAWHGMQCMPIMMIDQPLRGAGTPQ